MDTVYSYNRPCTSQDCGKNKQFKPSMFPVIPTCCHGDVVSVYQKWYSAVVMDTSYVVPVLIRSDGDVQARGVAITIHRDALCCDIGRTRSSFTSGIGEPSMGEKERRTSTRKSSPTPDSGTQTDGGTKQL